MKIFINQKYKELKRFNYYKYTAIIALYKGTLIYFNSGNNTVWKINFVNYPAHRPCSICTACNNVNCIETNERINEVSENAGQTYYTYFCEKEELEAADGI
jgi:hypothetical protein